MMMNRAVENGPWDAGSGLLFSASVLVSGRFISNLQNFFGSCYLSKIILGSSFENHIDNIESNAQVQFIH